MNIHILKSKIEIYKAVAKIIIEQVNKKPASVLGLATGETPIGIYEHLVKNYVDDKTDYSNITTINLDEYVGLKKEHYASYHSFMHNHLFSKININMNNTYFPYSDTTNHLKTCELYNHIIAENPIDIQLLGIGSNGHIGFNEPNTPFCSRTHLIALEEKTRVDNVKFFNCLKEVPKKAITMGIKDIVNAKKIILVALGRNKSLAIAKLILDEPSRLLPASALKNHPNVEVFLDTDSAILILRSSLSTTN